MKFLKRLFGKRKSSESASGVSHTAPSQSKPAADASKQDDLIRVFDAYGRELHITKKDWRDNVLLGNLEKVQNDPEQLYGMIVGAIDDGFAADTVPFAEHLQRTDPTSSRGAVLLGIVYMEVNRLDDAERTFRNFIQQHGEEGYVLTNLSKVFYRRGDFAKAEATLWRAIEVEPNQENAVTSHWAVVCERDGDEAGLAVLRRISRLPGSWRAQLWLARLALEEQQIEQALKLYEEVLKAAPRPIPRDVLMQLSGDLGNHGHLVELLKLTQPHFDITQHGIEVGNNLIKANVELGRLDHARAILDKLYALKRPDYQPTLSFWDTEIAKASVTKENALPKTPLSVEMLTIQGPIWLPDKSSATSLFPSKQANAVVVCILGASVDSGMTGEAIRQLADTNGRITRALTLFLSEQLHLRTDAVGQVIQPWILPDGFMLSGKEWESEFAIDQARGCQPPGDYIVLTHLFATSQPQTISFRLLRCIDGTLLGSGSAPVDPANLEPCFLQLADEIMASLCQQAAVDPIQTPTAYRIPRGLAFSDYQLRLEQALAVRVSAMESTSPEFLNGAREIIAGNLHLCLDEPDNVTTRILLAETLGRMKNVHPQVIEEFRDKVRTLQKEMPVPEPVHTVIQHMLTEVFAA